MSDLTKKNEAEGMQDTKPNSLLPSQRGQDTATPFTLPGSSAYPFCPGSGTCQIPQKYPQKKIFFLLNW